MNKREHTIAGVLAGAGTYFILSHKLDKKPSFEGVLISGITGALTSSIPDWVEPAYSPSHRKFFHSLTANIALIYLLRKILNNESLEDDLKILLTVLGAGYNSHTALDLLTKKGFPLI